ncbi:threonine--tRNA ligase [Dethiobacter alkaliphilus]|uniref:threonine--tRNA ligase n=1 Tax=Dethiobacter alkaliphilus TaxID=427926 RepID=UPI0022274E41|nr:threonine--tRNA ligase [Dethiobacter alkaliphilus]MCW3491185.1 threonine--tRNA ligase [Dethiobacter alkaliphilus]
MLPKVTLPDGSVREYTDGTTVSDVVADLGGRLKKEAVAAKVNGVVRDLTYTLAEDAEVRFLTFADDEGAEVYRHTSSHILALAVKRLFKGVKLGIGPAIKDGFYYDFDYSESFVPADLEKIEKEMEKIIKESLPLERFELERQEAVEYFNKLGEDYKVELIQDLPEDAVISCYRCGEFVDLCAGPHLPTTGRVKAVKLLNLAGAYWRGSENNPMLQRIYGTSFPKRSQLDEYLHRLEEAKKRDHRKLGRELDLFSIQDEGPGFPLLHPRGMIIRNALEEFWREEHRKAGYDEIKTPIILNRVLWERSGHWDHYQENMYFTKIDEQDFSVKPMNCPGSMLVYKTKMHSYRDLPVRMGELGLVHRHELSGTLHGMMRVRAFTQDDAHIFMLPSQIKEEVAKVIELTDRVYNVFGFDYHVELSTKPEKAMGSDEMWDVATNALREVLEERGMQFVINEGDGAFYGPKIDFHLQDSIGRTWQCGTIQLDFQMPEKFDIHYVGEDGQKHRPAVIHRVIYGSIERFMAVLIEHFAGAFPVWLAPQQVVVLPITDKHHQYAQTLVERFKEAGVRAEADVRNEKIGYKIREAQVQKVPYMLVVGDKEMEAGQVSVRERAAGDVGSMEVDAFLAKITAEIANKQR